MFASRTSESFQFSNPLKLWHRHKFVKASVRLKNLLEIKVCILIIVEFIPNVLQAASINNPS